MDKYLMAMPREGEKNDLKAKNNKKCKYIICKIQV